MFSKVIADAKEYTRPVTPFFKFADRDVESSVGTYVHVDDLGHILSARHIFTVGSEDPLVASAMIFDCRYSDYEIIAADVPNDLILVRVKDYRPGSIRVFPKFLKKSEGEISKGTPFTRLGFPKGQPYSHVPVTWDEANRSFHWDSEKTKLSFFCNDGFASGYTELEDEARFLETNSLALNGQSGGPLLTAQGTIVGITSRNSTFEGNPPLTVSFAASHIAIAKFLEKQACARVTWM